MGGELRGCRGDEVRCDDGVDGSLLALLAWRVDGRNWSVPGAVRHRSLNCGSTSSYHCATGAASDPGQMTPKRDSSHMIPQQPNVGQWSLGWAGDIFTFTVYSM